MLTQEKTLSENAMANLEGTENEIELSSQYFKPREGKVYMIRIDPEEKIEPRLNDRFKDSQGRPIIRYDAKITHINSNKQQIWSVSKTLCAQIVGELKQGFTVLKIERFGSDRSTVYKVAGIE